MTTSADVLTAKANMPTGGLTHSFEKAEEFNLLLISMILDEVKGFNQELDTILEETEESVDEDEVDARRKAIIESARSDGLSPEEFNELLISMIFNEVKGLNQQLNTSLEEAKGFNQQLDTTPEETEESADEDVVDAPLEVVCEEMEESADEDEVNARLEALCERFGKDRAEIRELTKEVNETIQGSAPRA
jgi:DNA-binding transcriptional MerR regulator